MDRRETHARHAEEAARYLLQGASKAVGSRHRQGARRPPLSTAFPDGALGVFATERIHRVPRIAVDALLRWAHGHPVELLTSPAAPADVLTLQARGARCVSLLPETVSPAPHRSGFDFALHDLCHLGKFVCDGYYQEQVGFFATLHRVLSSEPWRQIEAGFDETYLADRDHVVADMNGSAVFLFAAFKMKLRMAVRRQVARARGGAAPTGGALDADESAAFDALFQRVLDAFGFTDATLRRAAVDTSTRRDCPEAAGRLVDFFREVGARAGARPDAELWPREDSYKIEPDGTRQ